MYEGYNLVRIIQINTDSLQTQKNAPFSCIIVTRCQCQLKFHADDSHYYKMHI